MFQKLPVSGLLSWAFAISFPDCNIPYWDVMAGYGAGRQRSILTSFGKLEKEKWRERSREFSSLLLSK